MWKRWFQNYKVPKTIDRMVEAGIFKDKTNARDVTPHFEATLIGGKIVLWVDHPSIASRYFADGPRYIIDGHPDGESPENILATDSLDEVIFVMEQLFSEGKGLRLL